MFRILLVSILDKVGTVVPGEAGIGTVVDLGDVVLVEVGDGEIVRNPGVLFEVFLKFGFAPQLCSVRRA